MIRNALIVVFCCAALLLAFAAAAHPAQTSAVFLDVKSDREIDVEMQVPVDQLEMALPELRAEMGGIDAADVLPAAAVALLQNYVASHVSVALPDGRAFSLGAGDFAAQQIDGAPYIVGHAKLIAPDDAALEKFSFHYDVILHRVVTHKIYLSLRNDFSHAVFADHPRLLDVIRYQHSEIAVDRALGSSWQGFAGMFRMGARHILEGTDHLLFLFVLLLPAPLVVGGLRRCAPRSVVGTVAEIVKIVSAFTLGHSLTLLLGATGLAVLPSQPVEVLVAVSIIVSAVCAVLPSSRVSAAWIAGGFGLVHGLAFADALGGFGFNGSTLLLALTGFNLGIEITQLALVACALPVLLLLARTRFYHWVRTTGACAASVMAALWIVDRVMPSVDIFGVLLTAVRSHTWLLLFIPVLLLEFVAWRLWQARRISNTVPGGRHRQSAPV
jgi:hypothetical protein